MNKKLETFIVTICALGLVVLFGGSCITDIATPCHIEEDAVFYADEKPTSYLPWTTLWDAERIDRKMDFMHQLRQINLLRELEDDDLNYCYIKDIQRGCKP